MAITLCGPSNLAAAPANHKAGISHSVLCLSYREPTRNKKNNRFLHEKFVQKTVTPHCLALDPAKELNQMQQAAEFERETRIRPKCTKEAFLFLIDADSNDKQDTVEIHATSD